MKTSIYIDLKKQPNMLAYKISESFD